MASATERSATDVTDAAWPLPKPLLPVEHLLPLTNNAVINPHVATIEDLEDAQFAWCAALQRRPTSSGPPHASVGGPGASPNVGGQGGNDIRQAGSIVVRRPAALTLGPATGRITYVSAHSRYPLHGALGDLRHGLLILRAVRQSAQQRGAVAACLGAAVEEHDGVTPVMAPGQPTQRLAHAQCGMWHDKLALWVRPAIGQCRPQRVAGGGGGGTRGDAAGPGPL